MVTTNFTIVITKAPGTSYKHKYTLVFNPRLCRGQRVMVVSWFVCLFVIVSVLTWIPQRCVYSMDSLYTTSYSF